MRAFLSSQPNQNEHISRLIRINKEMAKPAGGLKAFHQKAPAGGLKGLIQKTGGTLYATGLIVRDYGTVALRWSYKYGGNVAFVVATTSMVVLLPLIFESSREVQVCSVGLGLAR